MKPSLLQEDHKCNFDSLWGRIAHNHELARMYCEQDRLAYEEVVRQARATERDPAHTDKEHDKRVSKIIAKEWGPYTPPGRTTLLPMGQYRVAFLRIDTRAVEQMYGMKREKRDDFFLQRFFHLTSKTANIPCMKSSQNRKYTRNVEAFVEGIRRRVRTPWLLGASVMSDGVQLKATINSLHADHPLAPGTKVRIDRCFDVIYRFVLGLYSQC